MEQPCTPPAAKQPIFATYADDDTGYKGYADILGDTYGNGKTVLIGFHPELSPQYPDIIAKLIVWATKTSGTVTLDQTASAASSVKNFYDTNNRLPNYVTISGQQITMPQFLYLLTTGTLEVNSGYTASITVKKVNPATSPLETTKSGNIQKSEYF